ncbi:MAG: DUF58 domain-containing protein [Clostridia bacterium]|nr:DUF58 domain-containing protein [Clostridia bacterium]
MTIGFAVYIIWLLSAALLFILLNNIGTLIILIISAVVPAALIIMTASAAKRIKIAVATDYSARKNEPLSGRVIVSNGSFFPAYDLSFNICCKNFLNGETDIVSFECSAPSKGSCSLDFAFSTEYAGKIKVFTDNIRLMAPAGIFRFRIKSNPENIAEHIIVPETAPCNVFVADLNYSQADGDLYSMHKSGNDPSETFLIREYVPGDPIKNIHWKLTEKVDRVMVRELGLPIKNDILLLFDMGYDADGDKPSRKDIDTLAETVFSVSQALIECGFHYTLGFLSNSRKRFHYHAITSHSERMELTDSLLSNTFAADEIDFVRRYMENKPGEKYQHILFVTLNKKNRISYLCDSNRVTVLMLNPGAGSDSAAEGLNLISMTNDGYKEAISAIGI